MVEIIKDLDDNVIKKIVKIIDNGGVVCFPTETVYALAADASNDEAIKRIYEIKRRMSQKPLSVLVGDIYQAKRIVHFDERANKLSLKFFPGPITLILKTKEHHNLSKLVNQELGTVGIRMPNHVLSLKIIKAVGRPVVGTSANISGAGGIYATDATQIIETLGDKIDLLIDQGPTEHKIESTIVDLSSDETKVLREGIITKDIIFDSLN